MKCKSATDFLDVCLNFHRITLNGHEVVICCHRISSLSPHKGYWLSILSESEQCRAEKYICKKKQMEFICCRGMLRAILGLVSQRHPEEIYLAYDKFKKPQLAHQNLQIFFNLSHAADVVAYAFSKSAPVGIDIEHVIPLDDIKALANMICSRVEYQSFLNCSSEDQLNYFYDIWVQKEAILKARGTGLFADLQSIDVNSNPCLLLHNHKEIKKMLNENYRGAVTLQSESSYHR